MENFSEWQSLIILFEMPEEVPLLLEQRILEGYCCQVCAAKESETKRNLKKRLHYTVAAFGTLVITWATSSILGGSLKQKHLDILERLEELDLRISAVTSEVKLFQKQRLLM